MKCLTCGREMINNLVQLKDKQIAYDTCESCGSLWLDHGELDKIAFQVHGSIEYSSTKKAPHTAENKKDCPRCNGVKLDKVFFLEHSDILLDRCSNCGGFWLDAGELDLINTELRDIMPVHGKGFSQFVNNVHLPYWHKRIKRKSSQTDFKVDVPPIKGAKLKSKTQYPCPACDEKLNLYEIFRTRIEACPQCRGMFLDKGELRSLKDRSTTGSWQTLRWLDDEVDALEKAKAMPSTRSCPKCTKTNFISTFFGDSKIILDWCPSCHGIWLDSGEFQQILAYMHEQLNNLTSDQMKTRVYEEIREIWDGPENKLSEIRDAKAAISALINVTIFEHPKLYNLLTTLSRSIPIR